MIFIYILLVVIILICLILIFGITTFDKFQENIIRINESEANIDAVLRKRFDLLNKSVEIISKELNKKIKEEEEKIEVMHTIVQLRSKKLSNFELDSQLYLAIDEFKKYLCDNDSLKKNKEFMKIQINLIESEAEIVSLRKYYNDITKKYNRLVKSFPSNIIALIRKYKRKAFFEEKEEKKDLLEELKS
jgi:LemA protein